MLATHIIRRLRDELLDRGQPSSTLGDGATLDDLAGYERASLERVAPLAELLFLMTAADGDVDDRELEAVRGAVRELTDGLLRSANADELVERFREASRREGHDERLAAVTARLGADRDDAEAAVMLAAAVALADDRVHAAERELFDRLVADLGVSRRRVDELLGGA